MDPQSGELLKRYEAGDQAAAKAIHDRYAQRLIAFARRMLADKLAARVDPDDVVQSAYRSFFVKARDGQFTIAQSGDLWRLLVAITRHKALHVAERHTAAKRSPGHEEIAAEFSDRQISPADVLAISDELQAIMASLSPDERRLLELRLRDESAETIGRLLGKSPRTVRRMLLQLRRTLERRLGASEGAVERTHAETAGRGSQLNYREFTLEQMVGAGAFGKVYRARWKGDMIVAVKSLRKQFLLDLRATANFVREAQMLAELDHPGIIRAHGLGRTPAGGYFLALDWHPGGDLSAKSGITVDQAAGYVAQAAEAIAYAHEHGIVHCDLKPSNLLVAQDGRIVVTDFGFAWATQCGNSQLLSGVGGTAGYCAPELWHSTPCPACDVYSLGRVLERLMKPADRGAAPNFEKRLRGIVRQCISHEPKSRLPARDLAAALRAVRS